MAVHVDDAFVDGDWGRWSGGGHMQADSPQELHAMAARLGLRRSWFQHRPSRPWNDHYDLMRSKREQAIAFGAIAETTGQGAVRRRQLRVQPG
jgi:hypothetical protein